MKRVLITIVAFELFQLALNLGLGSSLIDNLKTNAQLSNSSCIQGILESFILKNEKAILINFVLDSSKSLNDMGDYEACNPHDTNSTYFTFYPKGPAVGLAEGLCLPKECTIEDLNFLRGSALTIFQDSIHGLNRGNIKYNYNLSINDIYIVNPRSEKNHLNICNPFVIISLAIILFIIVLNILSFNILPQDNLEHSSKGIFDFILISFNPSINFSRVLEEEKSIQIYPIYGVKTLLLLWIMFCSSYWFSLNGLVNNSFVLYEFLQNSANSFIYFGYISIDCLLFVSGLITIFEIEKGLSVLKTSPIKLFSQKFVTLFLMMIFIYCLNRFVAPLLIDGPFAFKTYNLFSNGKIGDFFLDIFLLGNYIPTSFTVSCWSWLVATEFQFFIVSFVLYIMLRQNKLLIIFIILGLVVESLVGAGIIININDIEMISYKFSINFLDMYFSKPWTRFPSYGIGIILSLIFIKQKSQN